MTKYIRHKHKRHDPFINTPSTVYLNQLKTEVSIKQKNIDKLVFVESDEEESESAANFTHHPVQSSRQPRNNPDLTLLKRKTLVKEFKPTSQGLRPSLMRTTSSNQDDYDSIPNCQHIHPSPRSRKINFLEKRQSVPLRSNNYFDQLLHQRDLAPENNDSHQVSRSKEIQLREQHASQTATIHYRTEKKESKLEANQEKITIPQLQITSLYFEVSDEEPEKEKQTSTNEPEPVKLAQQKASDAQDINEKGVAEQSINEIQTQLSDPQKVDITDVEPNLLIEKRSEYLERLLTSNPSPEEILNAVFSPILPGTKQVFEVHVYSSLSEKEYYFWLNMSAEMRLMMKARKSTKLHKSEFEILTLHSSTEQFIETCRIVSNLDRSRFNILKVDRLTNKKRILGTLITSVNISNAKLLVLYHPIVAENNTPAVFYQDQAGLDLQQLYRQNKTGLIDYTITSRLTMTTKLNVISHYELRASEKSMEFKNNKGDINLIIGKKGSKRYKIISAPGLTPIQIFSMVIVQIET